jgi:hypothetical protein
MRLPAEVLSVEKRLFGAFEVSTGKADASELAERPSQLASQVRPELVAGSESLRLGFIAAAP